MKEPNKENEKAFAIHSVKHFYFKVNNSKLNDKSKFEYQVNKVVERIKNKHSVLDDKIVVQMGYVDDDFIYDRFRLRISVNCA